MQYITVNKYLKFKQKYLGNAVKYTISAYI